MEDEAWLKVGVAGALAQAHAADQRTFLVMLAPLLEHALPGQVEVTRHGGLLNRRRGIRELRVQLGDYRYSLEDAGQGPLLARRTLVKRGIDLSTGSVPVPEWIAELGEALEAYAREHREATAALRQFLEPTE